MKLIYSSLCVLAILALTSAPAFGQTKICLVDISKLFKANNAFNEQMAKLKGEADQFQMKLQDAQQKLTQMTEQLRTLDAAKPEYKSMENDIAQQSAKWEVDRRSQVRDLMQRESQLHFKTYALINETIGQYCAETQIPIVIRFSSEPMKLSDPETIMQAFNNSVVYYAPERDITNQIIERLALATPNQNR